MVGWKGEADGRGTPSARSREAVSDELFRILVLGLLPAPSP